MLNSLAGHRWTEEMSKAPFLNERSSRSLSDSGYNLLLDSENDTYSRSRNFFRLHTSTLIIIFLTAIVAVETLLLARTSPRLPHKGPVPQFPVHETTFESSDEWEFSPVAHDLWETLIDDSGLVTIQNPEQYGLHPGLETAVPGAAVYGVVFTHEYHCMRMIRNALVGLMTRDEDAVSELYVANTSVALPTHKLVHLFHCVDYLRQNILCQADTTLEWRSESNQMQIDGYGPPHQCRDWVEVRSWMVANHPIDPAYHGSPHG